LGLKTPTSEFDVPPETVHPVMVLVIRPLLREVLSKEGLRIETLSAKEPATKRS